MNKSHPFGLPIWKPALYKKSRSVVRSANRALHSSPSSTPDLFLNPGNILWLILFGWWLSLFIVLVSVVMAFIPFGGRDYGRVLRELAFYLLWPFGRYVERQVEITPTQIGGASSNVMLESDTEESDEETGLLGKKPKRSNKNVFESVLHTIRLGPAGCIYYLIFFAFIAPLLLLVSAICWMCVVSIPMAKLNYILVRHLHRHPLSLRFKSSPSGLSQIAASVSGKPSVILLCTYQAIGLQYYKYTFDGINIIFINLMPLVFFVIFDDWILKRHLPDIFITSSSIVFALSLASVIPLSYFIGMGVSSVSAQSSMGVGAVINATFGSIIEIILYAVALIGGKSALVEGALIGSFLAGVLLMPGCSMVSGAVKQKEQRFNAKSAGVTSTMLIMAIIGALTPTLFYQMFGSFELKCMGCPDLPDNGTIACSRCYYDQLDPTHDPVYQNSVKPLMWLCAAILPSAYIIGLVFSLHTHVDMVWKNTQGGHDKNAAPTYYQRLMPTHIISQLMHHAPAVIHHPQDSQNQGDPEAQTHGFSSSVQYNPAHIIVSSSEQLPQEGPHISYASMASSNSHIPIVNATGASTSANPTSPPAPAPAPAPLPPPPLAYVHANEEEGDDEEAAGHDSPNWSKTKSFVILFGCTLLYSIIAEILVDTVDEVMKDHPMDEKFLGLTLFALVPNITEFMNAISFALYGNIVLSMEIGSAYALQVCLLQIPAMVAFSVWYNYGKEELAQFTFSLVFPRWDVISVIFSVFLLTYTYQEGKANYFKGSILILSYVVLVAGFYFIPPFSEHSVLIGVPPFSR
ncbi:Sodium/calcium exchanger protein-domain-containing protein [Parasitella parasitica]|nr:Sodium/calcium exchanger protein-domain-containing protein [Parasitella parasitica]